jgi:hypothetical protein
MANMPTTSSRPSTAARTRPARFFVDSVRPVAAVVAVSSVVMVTPWV